MHFEPVLRENLCPDAREDYLTVIMYGQVSPDLADVNCPHCLETVNAAKRINGLSRLADRLKMGTGVV